MLAGIDLGAVSIDDLSSLPTMTKRDLNGNWDQIVTEADVLAFLEGKIAKWQMPKGVVWIDEVPKTSVGKFSKKTLRDEYAGTLMPG